MSGAGRIVAFVAAAFLITASGAGLAVAEVKPGTESGASVSKAGWWWRANEGPLEGNPVAPAPEPSPPNVPEGALPVAAVAGDPEKVSAIEFGLQYGPGATVTSMELSLRESKEPGANANADAESTKVVACPVTEAFWIDASAGQWKSLPSYDCDLAMVEGERGSNGTWKFDLTSIASLWLSDTDAPPPSIVLVEKVEAPESFQVAFDGIGKEGIGVKLVATGGGEPTPPPAAPAGSGDSGAANGIGSSGVDSGGVPTSGDPLDAGSAGSGDAAPEAAEVPATEDGDLAAQEPQAAPIGMPAQMASALESIPGSAFVLIPIVLGLAYAAMLALGPNGEPALAASRHGVGRALERMRAIREASKGEL